MKNTVARTIALATAFFLPALAQAHPGHEGDHDFGWDFNHLQLHPYATFLCGVLFYAAAWTVYRLFSRPTIARQLIDGR